MWHRVGRCESDGRGFSCALRGAPLRKGLEAPLPARRLRRRPATRPVPAGRRSPPRVEAHPGERSGKKPERARHRVLTKSFRRNVRKRVRAEKQDQSSGRRRRRARRKRVEGGWWSTFSWPQLRRCLGMCTDHARRARQLIRTTVLPSLTHHHYVHTPRCLQQLLSSLFRRARAAGLLLRLPTSQPELATAWSAAAGHAGGQEATCRGRS